MDLEALLDDAAVDAVAVDGDDRDLAPLLPELRDSGLLLLLPSAAPLEPDLVRGGPGGARARRRRRRPARAVGAVGADRRRRTAARRHAGPPGDRPWLAAGPAGRRGARRPRRQLVRGGGRGRRRARSLPADVLPGGAAVSWALLTGSGATVLVSHDGPAPLVRLSFAAARLEAGRTASAGPGERRCRCSRSPRRCRTRTGCAPGLVATAAALAAAVGGGDVPAETWPWPADLGDLLVVARVLEALRTSARTEALVPVA
jgi:hypothetical protein